MSSTIARQATDRLPAVDNLRTGLVVWIIAGHALLGYSAVGGWPYDEVNEVTFAPGSELVLAAMIGPSGLFVIGVFFFIAGLFAPGSLDRRGPADYARTRIARLGVPWAVSAFLVWPLFLWFAYRSAGQHVSYWWVFTHRDPLLDSGSLWFALVLLVFSLGLAGWRWLAGSVPCGRRRWGTPHLVVLVVVMAAATFLVRLGFPARSGQPGDLHLWQWPQCVGMFSLGVLAAGGSWPRSLPGRLVRVCGWTTLVVLLSLPVAALAAGLTDLATQTVPYLGGWRWQALVTAAAESTLVVAGSVWLLGMAQRRLATSGRRAVAWSRSAFAAFVLQGPVLLTLAMAARPLPWPAEAKAVLVGALAVLACFALGGLLVTRTPLRRWL